MMTTRYWLTSAELFMFLWFILVIYLRFDFIFDVIKMFAFNI